MIEFFGYQTYENQSLAQYPFNYYPSYILDWPWATYGGAVSAQDIINYYSNLLILQYHGKPKAVATIQALVTPVVMDLMPTQVQNGFAVDSAVGKQLDVLGKYTGVTRNGYGPTGPLTLSDADFRTFIQLSIVNNQSTAALASIQSLLFTYFPNEIYVFDHLNMRMSYFLSSTSTSYNLAVLFVTEGKLPKPLGVQLSSVIYASETVLTSLFGCRTYTAAGYHISPLNSYASYQTDYPFLTYADALVI